MENYNLLSNITKGIKYLREDFISFSINSTSILHVLENFFVSFTIILTFLLLGKKIRMLFFYYIDSKGLTYFIDIALGYIVVGSGIALLGSLSILYHKVLLIFLLSIFLLAIFPLNNLLVIVKDLGFFLKKIKSAIIFNKWIFLGISIFLLISFLLLIPPEIGEDSIGYHTDLPRLYLKNHTMIIPSKEIQHVLPIPQ